MSLTQKATGLPRSWRDYAGIIAEAKADAGSWREIVEDPPMTYQQANDAAAFV